MFVFASNYTVLNVPKILSVLEMGAILKLTVLYVVLGIGLYYESVVVFNRFASIFGIEETCMIKIDEEKQLKALKESSNPQSNENMDSNKNIIGSS